MNAPTEKFPATIAGYKTFELGSFTFARDEYFVTITWPVQGGRRLRSKQSGTGRLS